MKFDAIIIGTGQAGVPLAFKLANHGLKTAVIEKHHFGGTCVNTGCTPTKTYVGSARRAFAANQSADLGIHLQGRVAVDMRRVKDRKDEMILKARHGIEDDLKENEHITVYEGLGHFIGPKEVEVNGERLTADNIFINVGGSAFIPPAFKDHPYITNTEILELTEIPKQLIIVGGSYIGLEFGQIFRRFGSEVSIIEMSDSLISREDPDVSESVKEILEAEGVHIHLKAECLGSEQKGDQIEIQIACEDGPPTAIGSHLLLATGRRPNTHHLGLDKAGIETSEEGYIQVNDFLETNVPGVYALGDCNGKGAFTHTSYNDYEIVYENLFQGAQRKVTDRIPCYGLFIDPPLGRVGMTEKEAVENGHRVGIAKRPMSKIARAKEKGETFGFLKILVDLDTDQLLGASFLGVGGDEAVHGILNLMYNKAPYTLLNRTVAIHPTVSELIPTTLESVAPLEKA